jgi:PAS domain S-box-containing protein
VEVAAVPLVTPAGGRVELMLGLARDVTEQSRIESEQALLAAIVESSDDAIVSVDPRGNITSWNRGAKKLFGFSAAEAIGKPFTITVPPAMHAVALGMLAALLANPERPIRIEAACQRKDGTTVEVSLVAFAVRDRAGLRACSAFQRRQTNNSGLEARDSYCVLSRSNVAQFD